MIRKEVYMNLKTQEERVRKILGGFLILLLFWITVATGLLPFKQYVEELFIAVIVATMFLALSTEGSFAEKFAIVSGCSILLALILYIALSVNWVAGPQWNFYLQILVFLFLAGLILSLVIDTKTEKHFAFGSMPKNSLLRAIGGGLKFLAVLLGFLWLFTVWHN